MCDLVVQEWVRPHHDIAQLVAPGAACLKNKSIRSPLGAALLASTQATLGSELQKEERSIKACEELGLIGLVPRPLKSQFRKPAVLPLHSEMADESRLADEIGAYRHRNMRDTYIIWMLA
ncbi:unnamed protein product [Durusdinium trenchii]|uniref:Uncharacterized protein n=1 Tax=Durusdinium trenchii TaxID=1381693 RepID=A0ABP0MIW4_9DINO